MSKVVLAGESLPLHIASAFARAKPYVFETGAKGYHNGVLSAAVIGALRKRGFLTGPCSTKVSIPGDGCGQRTVSLLTRKGMQALEEFAGG